MRSLSTLVAVVALFVAAPAALAADGAPSGFAGNWVSIDCATSETGQVDCDQWGDGSAMTMHIGQGDTPRVIFQDTYASYCANNGSASTRWVAAGSGEYDDIFLWLTFSKSGCGNVATGGYGGVQLYHDAGSDTIWDDADGDGWGYIWYRMD